MLPSPPFRPQISHIAAATEVFASLGVYQRNERELLETHAKTQLRRVWTRREDVYLHQRSTSDVC